MEIKYANKNVEKYFTDLNQMRRILPFGWVKKIFKLIELFKNSQDFSDFINYHIWKPELLKGYEIPTYSLHISANARLIIQLEGNEKVRLCTVVEVKGVNDYHGKKDNWYIS